MPPDNRETTTQTPKRNKKTILVVVVTIALVTLLSLGVFMYRQKVTVLPCTDNHDGLLTNSSQLFDPENRGTVRFDDYDELSEVAGEIERQSNYEQDINCLYVMASYHTYSDTERAEETLDEIKFLHEDGQEISGSLAGASIERLEYFVLVQKTIREENAQNTFNIRVEE